MENEIVIEDKGRFGNSLTYLLTKLNIMCLHQTATATSRHLSLVDLTREARKSLCYYKIVVPTVCYLIDHL